MSYTRDTVNDLIYDEDSGEYEPVPVPPNPIVKELEANDTVYDIIGKGIVNNNSSTPLKMWSGTKDEYDALETKNNDTIYNVTDDGNINQSLLEMIYPVGSIYIGTMNICPLSALFGTWEKVSSGRVLQGADENHNPGTTIEAGLPNLMDILNFGDRAPVNGYNPSGSGPFYNVPNATGTVYYSNDSTMNRQQKLGFDASLSNSIYGNSTTVQPPAFVVNIWRRTA